MQTARSEIETRIERGHQRSKFGRRSYIPFLSVCAGEKPSPRRRFLLYLPPLFSGLTHCSYRRKQPRIWWALLVAHTVAHTLDNHWKNKINFILLRREEAETARYMGNVFDVAEWWVCDVGDATLRLRQPFIYISECDFLRIMGRLEKSLGFW